jgi:hypothetical protein
MHKIYELRFWAWIIANITVVFASIFSLLQPKLTGLGGYTGNGLIVLVVQAILATIFITPVWRWLWVRFPILNDWIFPDISGEWDVNVLSNRRRIELLLASARENHGTMDIECCKEEELPPLSQFNMRAKIDQSWARIHIRLWNEKQDTTIKNSYTLLVEPFKDKVQNIIGIHYIFRQYNYTDKTCDDTNFLGAARLEIQPLHQKLEGVMWTNRKWQRGLNTAAALEFTRAAPRITPLA